MRVLIPENTILWTANGICFGKDIAYGTEIFTIDSDNNLVTSPIIELNEPEEMKVHTIITKNNTCTAIPNYKIQLDERFVPIKEITNKNNLMFADSKHVKKFKDFHDENAVEFSDKSPFSAIGASYLGASGIKSNEAAYFTAPSEHAMHEFAKKLQSDLGSEFGNDISCKHGIGGGYKIENKKVNYTVLFRSEKFCKIRSKINLSEDKIHNSIYTNGLNIFFGFLRSILGTGFAYHLNNFKRGKIDDRYTIVNIPWKSKVRKLLQNTCFLWGTCRLSMYTSAAHMNLDELKIEKYRAGVCKQPILEIKEHLASCYEIEIPLGHKIIMDNIVIKPFELTDEETVELQEFEESEVDVAALRKNITKSITSYASIPKKINEIVQLDKAFKIHMIGTIKSKGRIAKTNTKYGKTVAAYAIMSDETGEIKIRLWSETAKNVKEGDILEIVGGYIKNGILQCSKNGYEKIHRTPD